MRTIRASEIGAYLYCRRAWWYQKQGIPSDNLSAMVEGSELHFRHGRMAMQSSCMSALAIALLILALVLISIHLANQIL